MPRSIPHLFGSSKKFSLHGACKSTLIRASRKRIQGKAQSKLRRENAQRREKEEKKQNGAHVRSSWSTNHFNVWFGSEFCFLLMRARRALFIQTESDLTDVFFFCLRRRRKFLLCHSLALENFINIS